jgi:hypothetical protein
MGRASFFHFVLEEETSTSLNLLDFEKHLNDIEREVFPTAVSRTVNDIGAKAKTAAMKELAGSMGVKKKALKKRYFNVDPSTIRMHPNQAYSWSGTSKPLPLVAFKGKGLKHRSQKGKFGYSAAVLGNRRKYKFFSATMASGHVGAFYRKSNSTHGRSNTGNLGEYPIKQAYGVSIPTGMVQAAVERAWNAATKQPVFEKKLQTNIDFYSSRFLKKKSKR